MSIADKSSRIEGLDWIHRETSTLVQLISTVLL